jgi:hypothetical protein
MPKSLEEKFDGLTAGLDYFETEEAEQPEEVVETTKRLGVRARNKLSKDLQQAWNESKAQGKFIIVLNDVWDWVRSRSDPNDLLSYTLLLSYDLSWLWSNKGNRNRWGIGRFTTIERMAEATGATEYQIKKYRAWLRKQNCFELWRSRLGTHFRPTEEFIAVLEGAGADW